MQLEFNYSENPFLASLGLRLEEWREGYVRVGLELQPHHLNRSGIAHGGLLATLLDHVGGFCGVYCATPGNRRYSMTLSLSTNFLEQSRSGFLIATGSLISSGSKIYSAHSEVRTSAGVLLAMGRSTHRYRGGSERREGVPFSGGVERWLQGSKQPLRE